MITGKVTALTPGPQGSVYIGVSLIKAYKAGRLTITQAGENMSVKLVSACMKCPVIRKGNPFFFPDNLTGMYNIMQTHTCTHNADLSAETVVSS